MRTSPHKPNPGLARALRKLALWSTGPLSAGVVLALAALAGQPVTGPVRWLVHGLSLLPAVLVHCHNQDRDLTWPQTTATSLAAAVVAYLVIVVGMTLGVAATFAVYLAAHTGALAVTAQLVTVSGFVYTLVASRHSGCTGANQPGRTT